MTNSHESSYRDSHTQKGDDYQQSFDEIGHRNMLWRLEQRFLRKLIARQFQGMRVRYLDFACGTGRVTKFVSAMVDEALGVDVSDSMMAVARENSPDVKFLTADLTVDSSQLNGQFDLITAFRFFPNAEPELRAAAMRALSQQLKPGGLLVFNNHRNASSFLKLSSRLRRRPASHSMFHHEVCDLLKDSSLELLEMHGLGVLPFTEAFMPIGYKASMLIETAASKIGLTGLRGQDVIYVAKK